MQNKKYSFAVLLLLFFTAGSLFAQVDATATSDVTITLQKGLSITATDDLNFGEYVILGSNSNVSATTPVNLIVTGEASKEIDFSFDTEVELTGSGGSLTFTTLLEETGTSSIYTGGSSVTNGGSEFIGGDGTLNLWLGGSIAVPSTANSGAYSGTFEITVAY